jgi:hypothetical protein
LIGSFNQLFQSFGIRIHPNYPLVPYKIFANSKDFVFQQGYNPFAHRLPSSLPNRILGRLSG